MTELVIFTAGRDDAFADYQRSVVRGISLETLAEYFDETVLTRLTDAHSERAPVWCTQLDQYWQRLSAGDEAIFYHNKRFVGRATVLAKATSLPLAEDLWRAPGTTWKETDPWKYIVFFDDFREISIPVAEFNAVFGYKQGFIPKGVMCVKEETIRAIDSLYGDANAALDALEAGTATQEVPVESRRPKRAKRKKQTGENSEKAKSLQEMYRRMLEQQSAQE
ncbi:hypothetical protein [Haladaptatus sp. YSMS36]|uniref:hypothetical protein n=1 Tax=Haladaptatus sp. YSMS36 TaxID=3033384 RepID=UPI0023E8BDF7|nr:hypothetical protein [Haladaptatus sp. YSMS36]